MLTILVGILLAAPQANVVASAPGSGPAACNGYRHEIEKKVTYCGDRARSAPLSKIAERFAPILWFSPNEPLLWTDPTAIAVEPDDSAHPKGKNVCNLESNPGSAEIRIPSAVPWDTRAPGAVVYYQIVEYDGPRESIKELSNGTIDLTDLRRLELRYFFYYRCDIGANPHPHDLEGVQMRLEIGSLKNDDGVVCRRLHLTRVTGMAHGLEWVFNRLRVAKLRRAPEGPATESDTVEKRAGDLLMPVTILVEEGKHASSPDRNGDGAFTSGYDANERPGEAWGIRDNFGAGILVSKYTADSTKPRVPRDRVFPEAVASSDPLHDYYESCSSPERRWGVDDAPPATYTLLPPPTGASTADASTTKRRDLGNDFGQAAQQHNAWLEALDIIGHRFALTARWDQPSKPIVGDGGPKWPDQIAWTLPGWHPDPVPIWLAPRLTFPLAGSPFYKPARFDALLMPTASRWFDTYVSLWGIARGDRGQLLPEAGFRIRLVSKEKPLPFPRWLARLVPMRGIRIGLRLPSLRRIFGDPPVDDTPEKLRGTRGVRLVFEIGGGAF